MPSLPIPSYGNNIRIATAIRRKYSGSFSGCDRFRRSASRHRFARRPRSSDPRVSTNTTRQKSEIEIGLTFLARSHWGGAYNGEMKQLMMQHAFQFVENVMFVIGPQNFRSRKAVEKIGGVLVGTKLDANGRRERRLQNYAKYLTLRSAQRRAELFAERFCNPR